MSVKKVQESSKTWRGDLYHHMLLRKFLQGNVWNTLAKPWFVFEVLSCQRSSASHRVFSIPIVCKYCSGYFHTHHCTRTQSNKYGQDHRWDYLYKKEISKTFFLFFCAVSCFIASSQTNIAQLLHKQWIHTTIKNHETIHRNKIRAALKHLRIFETLDK